MSEKEIAALVEQTIKVKLKDYIRDVVQEVAVAQAAAPEPEWSVEEGLWAKGRALGITDGARPCAPAARCEVVAMMLRAEAIREQLSREAAAKAEEMGLD